MPDPPATAADAIRYCRERAAMSARAVSLAAGLGDAYVSRVEAGEREPSLRCFARIARVLKMSEREIGIVIAVESAAPLRGEG